MRPASRSSSRLICSWIGYVDAERLLGPDALIRHVPLHLALVAAPRQGGQVRAMGGAKLVTQGSERGVRDIAHRVQTEPGKHLPGRFARRRPTARTPEAGAGSPGRPAGTRACRPACSAPRRLGDELVEATPTEQVIPAHPAPAHGSARRSRRGAEPRTRPGRRGTPRPAPAAPRRGDPGADRHHRARRRRVAARPRRQEHGPRTQPQGLAHRHRAAHPVAPRLVGRGGPRPGAPRTDDDGPARQLRPAARSTLA